MPNSCGAAVTVVHHDNHNFFLFADGTALYGSGAFFPVSHGLGRGLTCVLPDGVALVEGDRAVVVSSRGELRGRRVNFPLEAAAFPDSGQVPARSSDPGSAAPADTQAPIGARELVIEVDVKAELAGASCLAKRAINVPLALMFRRSPLVRHYVEDTGSLVMALPDPEPEWAEGTAQLLALVAGRPLPSPRNELIAEAARLMDVALTRGEVARLPPFLAGEGLLYGGVAFLTRHDETPGFAPASDARHGFAAVKRTLASYVSLLVGGKRVTLVAERLPPPGVFETAASLPAGARALLACSPAALFVEGEWFFRERDGDYSTPEPVFGSPAVFSKTGDFTYETWRDGPDARLAFEDSLLVVSPAASDALRRSLPAWVPGVPEPELVSPKAAPLFGWEAFEKRYLRELSSGAPRSKVAEDMKDTFAALAGAGLRLVSRYFPWPAQQVLTGAPADPRIKPLYAWVGDRGLCLRRSDGQQDYTCNQTREDARLSPETFLPGRAFYDRSTGDWALCVTIGRRRLEGSVLRWGLAMTYDGPEAYLIPREPKTAVYFFRPFAKSEGLLLRARRCLPPSGVAEYRIAHAGRFLEIPVRLE